MHVKTGTIIDATIITPANMNDGRAGPDVLPDTPGEVFADNAYRGEAFKQAVRAKGGKPRVVSTGMYGFDEVETLARLRAWNGAIHKVRGQIENIFGTCKRSYGLAKAVLQIRLIAIAYNLRRRLNNPSYG